MHPEELKVEGPDQLQGRVGIVETGAVAQVDLGFRLGAETKPETTSCHLTSLSPVHSQNSPTRLSIDTTDLQIDWSSISEVSTGRSALHRWPNGPAWPAT